MKLLLWPIISCTVFLFCVWTGFGISDAAEEIRKSKIVNGSRKLDFGVGTAGTGFNPQAYGQTYDEIVVESSLNVRQRDPNSSARTQKSRSFLSKANATDSKADSDAGTSGTTILKKV